jgi:uncharacterized protein (TIGR02284 family)
MSIHAAKAARVLNRLIKADQDVCEEFKITSQDAESKAIKYALDEFSRESRKRVRELQTVVRGFGEDAAVEGTLGSWLHRGWTSFRSGFGRQSDHANPRMLHDVSRGRHRPLLGRARSRSPECCQTSC